MTPTTPARNTSQIGDLRLRANELYFSLSEPQRRMLADDVRSIGNPERLVLCGDIVQSKAGLPTLNVLKRTGLLELTQFGPNTLTPLGLAVRALATPATSA